MSNRAARQIQISARNLTSEATVVSCILVHYCPRTSVADNVRHQLAQRWDDSCIKELSPSWTIMHKLVFRLLCLCTNNHYMGRCQDICWWLPLATLSQAIRQHSLVICSKLIHARKLEQLDGARSALTSTRLNYSSQSLFTDYETRQHGDHRIGH